MRITKDITEIMACEWIDIEWPPPRPKIPDVRDNRVEFYSRLAEYKQKKEVLEARAKSRERELNL